MTVEVKVPRLAESVSEAVLAEWLKPDGETVRADEPILTLETDKAAVEIAASDEGVLHHARQAGEKVMVGDVLARIDASPAGEKPSARVSTAARSAGTASAKQPSASSESGAGAAPARRQPAAGPAPGTRPTGPPPTSASASAKSPTIESPATSLQSEPAGPEPALSPAVRRLVEEHGLDPAEIEPSGRGGRLLKEDVLRHLEKRDADNEGAAPETEPMTRGPSPRMEVVRGRGAATGGRANTGTILPMEHSTRAGSAARGAAESQPGAEPAPADEAAEQADERVVPMSRIRQRIAERLVQAQHTAAILTTFNEIDMSALTALRARHRESFEKRHGVRLGLMSFFTRAAVLALEEIPELNAQIRGTDLVYRGRVHMGIAVGTERGLVVPVVRDAHRLGFAEIEREIARLSARARDGTLTLQELTGGTFTISNGGVYGSLLSTPILNPPQSGILGMHKIEKRPIALDDQVVVRPMMYVALSYDHRIVDGEQAVTFLVRVKERLEDPERMLLDV